MSHIVQIRTPDTIGTVTRTITKKATTGVTAVATAALTTADSNAAATARGFGATKAENSSQNIRECIFKVSISHDINEGI